MYRRIAANIIDFSVGHGVGSLFIMMLFYFFKLTGTNLLIDLSIMFMVLNIAALSQICYQSFFIKKFGFTFGRYVMGVKLSSNGNIIKREFIKWYLMYISLFMYSVLCLYNMLVRRSSYHEVKSNIYIVK